MSAQPANRRAQPDGVYRATRPLDVTVLMGGPSTERDISLITGEAVAAALDAIGHTVTRADICPTDTHALDREAIEVVFIALHGDFGESGEVQTLCEERGLKYTGSGPRASHLAMDKIAAKQAFKRAGLATPDWQLIEGFESPEVVAGKLAKLTGPVVVKPIDGGSSVDITIAHTDAERDAALENVVELYGRALVEAFVAGRELTVGILGDQALPVLEIVPTRDFYDKTAKYADDAGTEYVFDHGLDESLCRGVQAAAMTAHSVLDCRDMSRVDFILDADNVPQVLEINTIPGFTSHSLLPMSAARVGIGFEELVDRLVTMAANR